MRLLNKFNKIPSDISIIDRKIYYDINLEYPSISEKSYNWLDKVIMTAKEQSINKQSFETILEDFICYDAILYVHNFFDKI